jgi:hypothetical protein
MGLGKTVSRTVKSTKGLSQTYKICKKLCSDLKLKVTSDSFNDSSFEIDASEPMKWLTTNWPNNINFKGELLKGSVNVRLEAASNLTSLTQGKSTSSFLDNIADSLTARIQGSGGDIESNSKSWGKKGAAAAATTGFFVAYTEEEVSYADDDDSGFDFPEF